VDYSGEIVCRMNLSHFEYDHSLATIDSVCSAFIRRTGRLSEGSSLMPLGGDRFEHPIVCWLLTAVSTSTR